MVFSRQDNPFLQPETDMSDRCEVEDGMELAIGEARELNKLKPGHELLRLFNGKKMPDEEYDKVWEEFQTRFGKPGLTRQQRAAAPAQAYFWAGYFCELKKAVEALKAPSAAA
jgi:hypothetical protein